MTLLFCNLGWMERYQGLEFGDTIEGGGTYVEKQGRGHEICNFSEVNGTFYGYVQPSGQQIDINRLGAKPEDESISGITVVWTATRPTGGTAVVGWYKDATVFRSYQKFSIRSKSHDRNGIDGFWIKAPSNKARLFAVDERTCEIPRQTKGGMGRANIWYADQPQSVPTRRRVNSLLKGKQTTTSTKLSASRKQDQERKAQIEKAAIRACCDHFETLGYSVESVEKDNLGWDLEARSGKTCLRIEVKGLSGSTFSVELTPNEYRTFAEESNSYRLVVVVAALEHPELFVCRYSPELTAWIVEGRRGRSLEIQTKQSASIRCR
ncbi:DUF3883 domain-containing protein [Gemmatimonas aurantiaca]|uniref:DUF3883 domain-containing protein n=1 Tax=Gemmatimonas aurantiaca TaxID=173480 RepID=UPI00301B8417